MSGQWIFSYLSLKCHHLSIVWILNVVAKYLSLLWEKFLHACLFHLQSFVKHSQSEITKKIQFISLIGNVCRKTLITSKFWQPSRVTILVSAYWYPILQVHTLGRSLLPLTGSPLSSIANSCPSTLLSAGWWLSFWHCGRTIPIIVGLRTAKVKKALLKKIWKTNKQKKQPTKMHASFIKPQAFTLRRTII